jgi:hypothetical protein
MPVNIPRPAVDTDKIVIDKRDVVERSAAHV